ncbi:MULTISPECIES: ATP-binding cassette domain-containing protein [unclassified Bradyrhizobium]|uniref:ATP-binding cassette domain-containing protein n=1 Tax=unclassified Bradyrhizobium TaxID=2631580 RepID=UPI001FFBB9A5|nr:MULTISPECIES: ATP-binding cassette domain-containing protein [unclassified Bradyrhizobium]MCK1708063.1 sugar ABC transporter ATP-binding protein [Bradyrhizobium sp. 143]MCK1731424.1 sugar ABC transporter ATP-binding protein [Bradyrhizobium sp. 142]
MASLVLEARNIRKSYSHIEVLRGANFSVREAEVVALIGDNGAGKSTLVDCLSGVARPDSGEILLEGKQVSFESPHNARQLGIETVYQNLALAPDLTPAANLFLGREMMCGGLLGRLGVLDTTGMRDRAARAFAELGGHIVNLDAAVCTLSGGQQQGVAVARSVAWASKIVFMDEPTAALGVGQRERLLNVIRCVRDTGISVVLISHNIPEVLAVSDRIEVLRHGRRVAQFDTTSTVVEELVAAMTGALVQENQA